MSIPEFVAHGNHYTLRWAAEQLTIEVERIREGREGHTIGEIKITTDAPGYEPYLHRSMFTLSSQQARRQLAQAMQERFPINQWDSILEQLYWMSAEQYRQGEPIMFAGNSDHPLETPYLLYPLLPEGQPTLLYGVGGCGKSWLADYIALSVQLPYDSHQWSPRQANVLFLDWETDFLTFGSRIKRLKAGLGFPEELTIRYRRCWQTLADDMEHIKRLVDEHHIEFIIVDSCGGACGGDISLPEPVNRFFSAIRYLGCTSLLLHHVPKSDNVPFGSAYFFNWARAVFFVKKADESDTEHEMDVGIFHKKANEAALSSSRGFLFRFLDESVTVKHKQLTDTAEFVQQMSCRVRIEQALKLGKMSTDDLVATTSDSRETITRTLGRMRDKDQVVKMGDTWGLPAHV